MTEKGDLTGFAEATYARHGVAEALIGLQDQRGLDALLLLCAAWLARLGLSLSEDAWQSLVRAHAPVQRAIILPLRQARRAAREEPRLAQAYQRLKEVEVDIEFGQLRMLAPLCLALGRPGGDGILDELDRCCQAQGQALDPPLSASLQALATAIDSDFTPR